MAASVCAHNHLARQWRFPSLHSEHALVVHAENSILRYIEPIVDHRQDNRLYNKINNLCSSCAASIVWLSPAQVCVFAVCVFERHATIECYSKVLQSFLFCFFHSVVCAFRLMSGYWTMVSSVACHITGVILGSVLWVIIAFRQIRKELK